MHDPAWNRKWGEEAQKAKEEPVNGQQRQLGAARSSLEDGGQERIRELYGDLV